jgi:hypothetical protein
MLLVNAYVHGCPQTICSSRPVKCWGSGPVLFEPYTTQGSGHAFGITPNSMGDNLPFTLLTGNVRAIEVSLSRGNGSSACAVIANDTSGRDDVICAGTNAYGGRLWLACVCHTHQ